MKITAERAMSALPVVDKIISDKRPLTPKGAYRMARLHARLVPEVRLFEQRRDALIEAYDHKEVPANAPEGSEPVPSVPADKVQEFLSNLVELMREELEIDVQPLPLATLGPADAESPISAIEMLALGELIVDDSDQAPAELSQAA